MMAMLRGKLIEAREYRAQADARPQTQGDAGLVACGGADVPADPRAT
jgi:hypothetical protein